MWERVWSSLAVCCLCACRRCFRTAQPRRRETSRQLICGWRSPHWPSPPSYSISTTYTAHKVIKLLYMAINAVQLFLNVVSCRRCVFHSGEFCSPACVCYIGVDVCHHRAAVLQLLLARVRLHLFRNTRRSDDETSRRVWGGTETRESLDKHLKSEPQPKENMRINVKPAGKTFSCITDYLDLRM